MGVDSFKNAGLNALPPVAASVLCGYANGIIPIVFHSGNLQHWAYRSIPCFALFLAFLLRIMKDLGTMKFNQLIHRICYSSEKESLRETMNDEFTTEENKKTAKSRYNELIAGEMMINSMFNNYLAKLPLSSNSTEHPRITSEVD